MERAKIVVGDDGEITIDKVKNLFMKKVTGKMQKPLLKQHKGEK